MEKVILYYHFPQDKRAQSHNNSMLAIMAVTDRSTHNILSDRRECNLGCGVYKMLYVCLKVEYMWSSLWFHQRRLSVSVRGAELWSRDSPPVCWICASAPLFIFLSGLFFFFSFLSFFEATQTKQPRLHFQLSGVTIQTGHRAVL